MTVAANVKQIIHPDTSAAAALCQPKTIVNNSRIFIVKFYGYKFKMDIAVLWQKYAFYRLNNDIVYSYIYIVFI